MPPELQQLISTAKRDADTVNGTEYLPAPAVSCSNGTWSLFTSFGGGNRSQVWGMAQHNGAMYFGIGGETEGTAQIWKHDGSWHNVTPFTFPVMRVPTLHSFNGYIYAGAASKSNESQLWRSQDGLSWTMVVNFGDSVKSIQALTEFNGHLYLTTDRRTNVMVGEVWSSVNNWASPIFSIPNGYAYTLHVHNGALHVGTGYPAEVHRLDSGVWTQISAFNNSALSIVETMTSYRGDLVVGFGRDFWAATKPPCVMSYNCASNLWAEVGLTQPGDWRIAHNFNKCLVVNDTLLMSSGSAYGGVSLWALSDGQHWEKLGGRPTPFGPDITSDTFQREWIYNLVWTGTDLYVSFAGIVSSITPAVWKYTP